MDLRKSRIKLPVCLCFDTSISMRGRPLENLRNAIDIFLDELSGNDSVETAIITFGVGGAACIKDFSQSSAKRLSANGIASIGEGVELALDILETREMAYSEMNIEYYRPWLLLTLNSNAVSKSMRLPRAIARTQTKVNRSRLEVFPVATNSTADKKILENFSPSRRVLFLTDYSFEKMLLWLADTLVRITEQSNEQGGLTSPQMWLEI